MARGRPRKHRTKADAAGAKKLSTQQYIHHLVRRTDLKVKCKEENSSALH